MVAQLQRVPKGPSSKKGSSDDEAHRTEESIACEQARRGTIMTKKRDPLDPHVQFAAALKAKRVCKWCKPHFQARLGGRPSDHTRCDDFDCGCHCQDRLRVN